MSKGSSSTGSAQSSQTQPWGPTIPYLEQFLTSANAASGSMGPTGNQLDAYTELMNKAAGGNPFTGQITNLTGNVFNTPSYAPQVQQTVDQLRQNLAPTASGALVNPNTNPVEQATLSDIASRTANQIEQQFAGAGRDVSGNAAGQKAIATGITQAELPYVNQLYEQERQNQIGANSILANAGITGAQTGENLNIGALNENAQGVPLSTAALSAENYAPNSILNLSQQLESLPFSDLAQYASLLLPAAGLGGQFMGTGTSGTSSSSLGMGGVGSAIGAIGSIASMFSDERVKHNIKHVGMTHDGQKIYSFQYKDDPSQTTHMGLLAQEVEADHPDAVGQTPAGIKTVNYDAALRDAQRSRRARSVA